jgi:hypothetical protein
VEADFRKLNHSPAIMNFHALMVTLTLGINPFQSTPPNETWFSRKFHETCGDHAMGVLNKKRMGWHTSAEELPAFAFERWPLGQVRARAAGKSRNQLG